MDENDTVESFNHKSDSVVVSPDENFDRLDTAQNSPLRNESDNSHDIDSPIDPLADGSSELQISETVTDDPSLNNTVNDTEDGENLNVNTVDDLEEMHVDGNPNESTVVKSKPDKLCQLPLGSVKRIVKSDPDVPVVNAESLFLITKATECFLQWLGKEVYAHTIRQKKKTIQLRDLHSAISEHQALEFLDGALD